MHHPEKLKPLDFEDRKLLSDFTTTFDLGTQTIIGQHEDENMNETLDLITETN